MFDERIALALPSLAGYDLSAALVKAKELGFQSVMSLPDGPAKHSLGPFPTLSFYHLGEEQRSGLARELAQCKHVALHQAWDENWSAWIDCAACVGAETVTIHAGRPAEGQAKSAFLTERTAWFRQIGDYAGEFGVRIGIENENGACEDYLQLVSSVAHPFVGATLDVGHCGYFQGVLSVEDTTERAIALNTTIRTMIANLGKKLFSLHVHDLRQSDWRDHRCVGSGVIDFHALFAELQRIDYAGLVEIELEEPDKEAAATQTGELLTQLCQAKLPGPSGVGIP